MKDFKELPDNADAAPCPSRCYDAMPVTEVIDVFLGLIRDAPIYTKVRRQLESIRDGIFLELPGNPM